MQEHKELIKRALDANALTSASAAGTAINPNMWDMRLREFEEAQLVMTPLCEQFDFRGPGVDYKVTIDNAPSAAAAIVETDAIAVVANSTRSVTFTPTEYGNAYQVTQKEMNRSFFDVMGRFSRKLGYALALKKDALAVSSARSAASTSVLVNSKSNLTDLASTDTMNYAAILKAARSIENLYYTPSVLIVNNFQKEQVLGLSQVQKVSEFGTRDALARGLIGNLFGVQIFATTQISNGTSSASNTAKAIMLGVSGSGERALGYAVKQDPKIATFYDILQRSHTIAAHEEYDFQALHPGAIATIASYSA